MALMAVSSLPKVMCLFLIKWSDGNGNSYQSIVSATSRKDARRVLKAHKVSWCLARIDSLTQISTSRQRVVNTVTTS